MREVLVEWTYLFVGEAIDEARDSEHPSCRDQVGHLGGLQIKFEVNKDFVIV